MISNQLSFQQYTSPAQVTPRLHKDLARCWIEVSNAGGAAGFPFPFIRDAASELP
ncbi:hypothetical protein [Streptomyces alanosinicus]|uniref:Uncharacterized protein n=1 Tax=Streptomyces alanosinicus TaxID=68171 RepID=A0A918YRF1_9ACTN|nr:hypothetical protein GCM10010339_83020 [Streptomyces alanosinicus]